VRLGERGGVATKQVDVVARRIGHVESHGVTDDKRHGFGFERSRVTRVRPLRSVRLVAKLEAI